MDETVDYETTSKGASSHHKRQVHPELEDTEEEEEDEDEEDEEDD